MVVPSCAPRQKTLWKNFLPKLDSKPYLVERLGPPKFAHETALTAKQNWCCHGLAYTPVGGDLLFIEASLHREQKLKLTGNLGNVMKESVKRLTLFFSPFIKG